MTRTELARYIDHTALKPETTTDQITTLCREAHDHGFAAVCVMPWYVPHARGVLDRLGSDARLGTTIGFPLGMHRTATKIAEARQAMEDGAEELDMVMAIGALKSGALSEVLEDIGLVVDQGHRGGAIVKVILETSLLSDGEKRVACEIASEAGADFVKTSTGFSGGGATAADIRLMRSVAASRVRVKASGGIRTLEATLEMIEAGADRIGTSSGVAIINGIVSP